MEQIERAKMQWQIERNKTSNDLPEWQDLVGPDRYLQSIPKCPRGGFYTIGKVSEAPSCSIAEHTQCFQEFRGAKGSATDTNRSRTFDQ